MKIHKVRVETSENTYNRPSVPSTSTKTPAIVNINLIDLSHATRNLIDISSKAKSTSDQRTPFISSSSRSSSSNSFSSTSEPQRSTKHSSFGSGNKSIAGTSTLFSSASIQPVSNKSDSIYDRLAKKSPFPLPFATKTSKIEMNLNFDKKYDEGDESFEEESLIERTKSESKSDDLESDDSLDPKSKSSTASSKFNIVESIDPTFKACKPNFSSKFMSKEMKNATVISRGL